MQVGKLCTCVKGIAAMHMRAQPFGRLASDVYNADETRLHLPAPQMSFVIILLFLFSSSSSFLLFCSFQRPQNKLCAAGSLRRENEELSFASLLHQERGSLSISVSLCVSPILFCFCLGNSIGRVCSVWLSDERFPREFWCVHVQ